jgi:nucleotide-binding universal stress UspA family protein
MPHIVAATDFSSRSQRAFRRAGVLARQTGAELTLVHVVDDDQPDAMMAFEKQEAGKFLDEQTQSLDELRGLPCRTVVTTGEAFDGILRVAESARADLIVMGSHRKQILRDIFIGTTIERVIRAGPYPVLMVNADSGQPYGSVTAGIDMSDPSAHALNTAMGLGLVNDANLTIVHAFAAVAAGKLYIANARRDQIDDYVASERMQASEALFAFLKEQGLSKPQWSYRVEEGDAVAAISRAVKETGSDLVVIGTHGRSGIVKLLIGSVAEEVLRNLDVDILAVPPPR